MSKVKIELVREQIDAIHIEELVDTIRLCLNCYKDRYHPDDGANDIRIINAALVLLKYNTVEQDFAAYVKKFNKLIKKNEIDLNLIRSGVFQDAVVVEIDK